MGRKASVKWYASRNAYFTFFNGKQHKLAEGTDDQPGGPTYLAALNAFSGLMNLANAGTSKNCNTVRTVFELYAQNLERKEQTRTLDLFQQIAKFAIDQFGDLRVNQLEPHHIQDFLHKMSLPRPDTRPGRKGTLQWTTTYQAFVMRALVAAFNYAKRMKYITEHCASDIKIEAKKGRGEEAFVPREAIAKLMASKNKNFTDLLHFMWATGCRPDEAYHAEARYYDSVNKCLVYPGEPKRGDYVWKNAKKLKKDRIIYVTDEKAIAIIEARVAKFPTGPIFQTNRKTPWNRESVGVNLRWMCKKLGISPVPTAYGFRHTFATDYLLDGGGSIKILAELMGTSVGMIERHYGHLQIDRQKMRNILIKTMAGRTYSPPSPGESDASV